MTEGLHNKSRSRNCWTAPSSSVVRIAGNNLLPEEVKMLELQTPLDTESVRMRYRSYISPATLARALETSALHGCCVSDVNPTSQDSRFPDVQTRPGRRMIKLFCKNHWFLAINPDGTVTGTRDQTSTYTNLQLVMVGRDLVQLYSADTLQYLTMDFTGRLHATRNRTDGTIFRHVHESSGFHTFASLKWSRDGLTEMYVAINRDGLPRNGARTSKLHKTSQFLII